MAYFIAAGARLSGDVVLGEDAALWCNAVVRGDNGRITVGACTNVQDNAVLHAGEGHVLTIGDYVTIGHGAIVHGCTVGDNTLIGMGAIVLNGAVIGNECTIGAGAVVTGKMNAPDGSLILGSPAKVARALTPEERAGNHAHAVRYRDLAERELKRGEDWK